jgi:hypothetical protein
VYTRVVVVVVDGTEATPRKSRDKILVFNSARIVVVSRLVSPFERRSSGEPVSDWY